MKEKILMIVFLSLSIAACQRQPQETDTAQPLNSSSPLAAQLDQAGEKIGKYLDQLDNPKTSQQKRIQILCKDYPTVYKTEYMPALLKLHSNEGEFKHEVRQFEKSYDNQQAEQISLMV